jgi:hypothetical protein
VGENTVNTTNNVPKLELTASRSTTGRIQLLAAILIVLFGGTFHQAANAQSSGNTQCQQLDPQGDLDCLTSINIARFATMAYQNQQADEWCWAASISMIFGFYGHTVTQAQIVDSTFGQLIDQAGQPSQIFQALNSTWTDDSGGTFTSTVTGLYDVLDGIDNISYTDIGAALNQNQPVLIGTVNPGGQGAHATVLSSLEFQVPVGYPIEVFPDGSNIVNAVVFDPWPTSQSLHSIPWPQFEPAGIGGSLFFAAIARVTNNSKSSGTSGAGSSGTSVGSTGGSGGTGSIDTTVILALVVFMAAKFARGYLQEREHDSAFRNGSR